MAKIKFVRLEPVKFDDLPEWKKRAFRMLEIAEKLNRQYDYVIIKPQKSENDAAKNTNRQN